MLTHTSVGFANAIELGFSEELSGTVSGSLYGVQIQIKMDKTVKLKSILESESVLIFLSYGPITYHINFNLSMLQQFNRTGQCLSCYS